jgi:hypothetical protein
MTRANYSVGGPEIGATRAHADRVGDSFGATTFVTAISALTLRFLHGNVVSTSSMNVEHVRSRATCISIRLVTRLSRTRNTICVCFTGKGICGTHRRSRHQPTNFQLKDIVHRQFGDCAISYLFRFGAVT